VTRSTTGDRITQAAAQRISNERYLHQLCQRRRTPGRNARENEGRGWSIFWDRTIPIGKTWRQTIGRELNDARCVFVLWSKTSIELDAVDAAVHTILGVVMTTIPLTITVVRAPLGTRRFRAGVWFRRAAMV
jgi:hypothetical protein